MGDATTRPGAERVGYVGLGKILEILLFYSSTTPCTPVIDRREHGSTNGPTNCCKVSTGEYESIASTPFKVQAEVLYCLIQVICTRRPQQSQQLLDSGLLTNTVAASSIRELLLACKAKLSLASCFCHIDAAAQIA